jgi:DNA-binding transcriptional LysR family regulator
MKACLSGLGVALLPAMIVSADLRAGRLIHVLQDYRRDGADLNIVLPSRQHIPTAVSAFVEFAMLKLQSITTGEVEAASGSANRRKARLA